jgi:predicted ATPase with chaperone activity
MEIHWRYSDSVRRREEIPLKVSRTVAGLEGKEAIESPHVSEANQYRMPDRNFWAWALRFELNSLTGLS